MDAGMTGALAFLIEVQRWIQGSLSAALSGFAASRDWTLLAPMLPMGVAFGAVHALTPGHSKAVLASYLVGSRLSGFKSLAIAGALSITHVGSAVVIALLAVPLISRSLGSAGRAPGLELLSRGLLA
jgi:nickel/cobalt transporter (NicO) family protein